MIPFLRQVAGHYFDCGDIEKRCFIFPNRRSLIFFRKYLSEVLKEAAGKAGLSGEGSAVKPILEPRMFTMNDFFIKLSGANVSDRESLLFELYDCYVAMNPKAEPLDDFIFWGDVILSDFDDVDKYMADPKGLFANVADIKELKDDYSYLSEVQREAINSFIRHFRDGGRLTVDLESEDPNVKERFLQIWDRLYPLYLSFNSKLSDKGLAYEGMAYRALAVKMEKETAEAALSEKLGSGLKYVFVGLNALNECEKTVMGKMRQADLAEFCWDYSSRLIRDVMNKSSVFMNENISRFPQAFKLQDDEDNVPDVNIVSVSSSVGQTKQVPHILESCSRDCAIVLPDENLLIPLLNTIPLDIDSVNVTMGYPMSGSSIYSLMSDISSMQMHLRHKEQGWYYYHKQVWSIFSNGLFLKVCSEEDLKVAEGIKNDAKYYIPQADLESSWLFKLIFRPIATSLQSNSSGQVAALEKYQLEIIGNIAPRLRNDPDMSLELNFAKEYYGAVNRLGSMELPILPMTYFRLLQQLIGGMSVPFRGEPLKGLQIMGPLETRALDFSDLIVLSCNEGIFPRRSVSSSFIPPELRKGFGLPTYEDQDIVWAYYFYRMIQRASKVWLLYDSRTEGLQSGEESRYIKQLEYHFRIPVKRHVAKPAMYPPLPLAEISKTSEDVGLIRKLDFSASMLESYLDCPARFYYRYVCGYEPENEVAESMDGGMIGSVFHDTMCAVYLSGAALDPDFEMSRKNLSEYLKSNRIQDVTSAYISDLLKDDAKIKAKVRSLIMTSMNSIEVSGRNLVLEDVICQYVSQTLKADLELMRHYGIDRIHILGLEMMRHWDFHGFHFVGYLDRMDSLSLDSVRIVDYKTGKVSEEEENISDEKAPEIVEKLFRPDSSKRPKIALQLFLYDMFVEKDPQVKGKTLFNAIYKIPKLFTSGITNVGQSELFNSLMKENLEKLLDEIVDANVPFRRTNDVRICDYCDFKMICGR